MFDGLGEHKVGEVFAPHALPMYREERNSKKRKERSDRKDPIRSKKPDPPVSGGVCHITQIVCTSTKMFLYRVPVFKDAPLIQSSIIKFPSFVVRSKSGPIGASTILLNILIDTLSLARLPSRSTAKLDLP